LPRSSSVTFTFDLTPFFTIRLLILVFLLPALYSIVARPKDKLEV
jgi:hypothetical protein